MIKQYRDGVIPAAVGRAGPSCRMRAQTIDQSAPRLRAFEFSKGLEAIWSLLSAVDKFIVEQAPWKLAKVHDPMPPAARRRPLRLRRNPCIAVPCCIRFFRNPRQDLGSVGMTEPLETWTRQTRLGPARSPARQIGLIARSSPHRRQERDRPHARARRRGNRPSASQTLGQEPAAEAAGGTVCRLAEDRHRRFRKSICASARSSPPSASKAPTSSCT